MVDNSQNPQNPQNPQNLELTLDERTAQFKQELEVLKRKYNLDFEIRKVEDNKLFIVDVTKK